jgi:peptidoglycan/xylan/chitin deacetylase (PgdA/CDA1 family)
MDRLATLSLFWPMSRIFSGVRQLCVPILMYHAVQERSSDPRPYFETNVSPQVFARQIQQLREAGYHAVSLEQALKSLRAGNAEQELVVITFDDGYRDFYDAAFPILAECHFTATVFLIAGYTGDRLARFKGKESLTWEQVRELQSHGMSFGSHTLTHPVLKFMRKESVEEELGRSKKTIEDRIGVPVRSFSYPYAFPETDREFIWQLKETLLKCGYENGVTTILGTANARSDQLFLPRLPINNWDDPHFFRAKLEGGYDWLHGLQYLSKLWGRLRPVRVEAGKDHDGLW